MSPQSLHCELLEMQDGVELVLQLVKTNSSPFNVVGYFLLGLLNAGIVLLRQHLEEIVILRINVEVILMDLEHLFLSLILLHEASELLSEGSDLLPDAILLLLS